MPASSKHFVDHVLNGIFLFPPVHAVPAFLQGADFLPLLAGLHFVLGLWLFLH